MKKLHFFVILLVVCSNSARAVGLEQLQINSYINEPLNASIVIYGVDEYDLADVIFSVASKSEYEKMLGTVRPEYLDEVKFNIIAIDEKRHEVQITSTQRVREPILNFLLKITERQGSFVKNFTLLIDPKIDPTKFLTNPAQPIALAEETLPRNSSELKSVPENAVDRNKIKVGEQSISIIAQNLALGEEFSVYQIMRAFYLENPQAFDSGNIDKLKSGTSLSVPSESLIGEVSRGQAINFVFSVSKDKVTKPVSTSIADHAEVSTILPEDEFVGDSDAQETLPQLNTNNESAKTVLRPRSDLTRREVKRRREMEDEFFAISYLLKSQSEAMKIQTEELISMANILHKQNQQIYQLRLRLNELTAAQQTEAARYFGDERLANSGGVVQQDIVGDHENIKGLVNRELMQFDGDFANLESELAVLTENYPDHIGNPITDSEQPAQFEVINENIAPKQVSTAQAYGDFSKLWITLIVIAAAMIFSLREWNWRRRFKMLPQGAIDEEIKWTQLRETPLTNESVSDDTDEIELRYFDDEDKTSTESSVTADKPKFSSEYRNIDEVKLECDTLIAYELYSEALQLVQSSRDKLNNDPWLDIKELEILASSRQCDEFFACFEQYKQRLELELPDPWKEVEILHEQLQEELKNTAVR